MRKDAELHADEDRTQREQVELLNQADTAAYAAEKLLRTDGEKLSADNKSKIEAEVKALREALGSKDSAKIRTSMDKLNEVVQAASAELYKAGQQAGAAPGAAAGEQPKSGGPAPGAESGKKGDGPIIDAEVVDDKK